MSKKIGQIKKLVKNECLTLGFAGGWFYDVHLLAVEKCAKELLVELPKANAEVVMLGVWLHDLQRVRGIAGDHAKMGAIEAEKVMKQFEYSEETIGQVKNMILAHSCDTKLMPKTLEEKILATADAMSHYVNDFYLTIALSGKRDLPEFKKWALEKLDKDFNKKIFFVSVKKRIAPRHKILKDFLTMG
jgi:HD superfamily phosphodiesterase